MPLTIAIGDIHGCSTALIRLIELVAPQAVSSSWAILLNLHWQHSSASATQLVSFGDWASADTSNPTATRNTCKQNQDERRHPETSDEGPFRLRGHPVAHARNA